MNSGGWILKWLELMNYYDENDCRNRELIIIFLW